MLNKEFVVYKHIFPNKKVYIGITQQEPKLRWESGHGYKNTYVGNAIQKYGWENVEHEILLTNLTKEEAEQKEIELIGKYKSNQKEYGYNIANGGNHKGKCSEETKMKISIANKGKNNGMYNKIPWNKGIKMSEEARKNMSIAQKKKEPCEEKLQKMRKANIERFKTGFTYTGKTRENIIRTALINVKKAQESVKRKVNQYDIEGNFIKSYNSIAEASRENNLIGSNISAVCLHKKNFKTAGGYKWEYVNK